MICANQDQRYLEHKSLSEQITSSTSSWNLGMSSRPPFGSTANPFHRLNVPTGVDMPGMKSIR